MGVISSRDSCKYIGILLVILLSCAGRGSAQGNEAEDINECPAGFYGDGCASECHCLNGASQCTSSGICLDYQCERGWTNSPECNEVCPEGFFGINCALLCHCPEDSTCDRVNGWCLPDYVCHPEWTGASCQVRRPRLVTPPVVFNVSCGTLSVMWRQWSSSIDTGDPPIGTYTVEFRWNNTDWIFYLEQPYIDGTFRQYTFTLTELNPIYHYQFRVWANRVDNEKIDPGLPSQPSQPVIPECREPTTEGVGSTDGPVVSTDPGFTTPGPEVTTLDPVTTAPPDRTSTVNQVITHPLTTDHIPNITSGPVTSYVPNITPEPPTEPYVPTRQQTTAYATTPQKHSTYSNYPSTVTDLPSTTTVPNGNVNTSPALGTASDNATDPLGSTTVGGGHSTRGTTGLWVISSDGTSPQPGDGSTQSSTPASTHVSQTSVTMTTSVVTYIPTRPPSRETTLPNFLLTSSTPAFSTHPTTDTHTGSDVTTSSWNTEASTEYDDQSTPMHGHSTAALLPTPSSTEASTSEAVTTTSSTPAPSSTVQTTRSPDIQTTERQTTPELETPAEVGFVTVSADENGRVFVLWNAPAGDGPVSNYIITYQKIGEGNCDSTVTSSAVTVLVSGTSRTYELANLESWSMYRVSVAALNNGGVGPETMKVFYSPEVAPSGTVQNLASAAVTESSLAFTWESVPCDQRGGILTDYDVIVRDVTSGVVVLDVMTRNNFINVDNLEAYTVYGVRVAYVNSVGTGPFSQEYQTRTLQSTPAIVRNITVSFDGSGQVFVHWNEPPDLSGPLSGYTVTYQQLGIGDCPDEYLGPIQTLQLDSSTTSIVLNDLDPWSRYRLTVRALNTAGDSQETERIFITPEIAPSGYVESIEHTLLTSTSVELTWSEVVCERRGGELLYYEVLLRVENNIIARNNRTTGRILQFQGLTASTTYEVTIYFYNGVGQGPPSPPYSITTVVDVPPPINTNTIQVYSTQQTSFTVSWANPAPADGDVLGYDVRYSIGDGVWIEQSTTSTTMEISGLEPFTEYIIQIRARNAAGDGDYSDSVTASTLEGVPGIPRDLAAVGRNQTCIEITWNPPADSLGDIEWYRISYQATEIQSASVDGSLALFELRDGTLRGYTLCNLLPAALYVIFVSAATASHTFGESASVQRYTELGDPIPPPIPIVTDITRTTITLTLEPVILLGGPVSGYYVVVDPVNNNARRRRSIPQAIIREHGPDLYNNSKSVGNYTNKVDKMYLRNIVRPIERIRSIPNPVYESPDSAAVKAIQELFRHRRQTAEDPTVFMGLEGYTTASIFPNQIRQPTAFVVGDNQSFAGYWNRPLSPETTYNITYVVVSTVDGITKMAASSIAQPHTTAGPGVTEDDTNIWIIIIPLILGLLLIIAIIIIICCMCRGKETKEEKPVKEPNTSLKATWLDYYTKNFGTLKEKKGIWSDIANLDESRHLTIFDDKSYMPDDLKVSVIQDGRPKLSFEQEYYHLPQGKTHPCTVAERPENQEKNRFEHILPYDHSRVILKGKKNDYINANYINGYSKRLAYIAAQSPFNDTTVSDFWYMVYQEKATQVVFLARLQEDEIMKSVRYWPEDQTSKQFGPILVRHVSSESFANFELRSFDVSKQGSPATRRVTQYQLTAWPDHGIPEDPIPFLDFRMKIKTDLPVNSTSPLIVHCGTGVSRTAVYIAVDSLLEQAKVENCVNVFKFTYKMRRNRTLMVRTLKQYVFLYEILFEALITNYNIVGDDLKVNYRLLSNTNPMTDKSYFRQQFEMLEQYIPALPPAKCPTSLRDQNKGKNRFESIVPTDSMRVPLLTPGGLGRTDYINALFVDGYLRQGEFIVTQTPLESTVIDFWKMVYDHGANTIVMLNNSSFKEDTCAAYWPGRLGMEKFEPFFVNLVDVKETEHLTIRTMVLTAGQRPNEEPREVKMFQYESWKMYDKVPWDRESFIQLMEAVEMWREDSNSSGFPAVIHCMDGASQSGLYCAGAVLCEKMAIEGEVDVFHTVKHMKRTRPHFINSLEQYKFCFKLLWDYLNTRIKGHSKAEYEYGDTGFHDTGGHSMA